MPFVFIQGFWFLALTAEPGIALIVTIGADTVVVGVPLCFCCLADSGVFPAATPTANGVLSVAGVLSMHHLGSCRSYCFTGVSAAVGVRAFACILAVVLLTVESMPAFVFFIPVVCVNSALASFPAAAGVLGLLLKAAFCCRLCYSWLKNSIGKISQDADPHPPPFLYAREGR